MTRHGLSHGAATFVTTVTVALFIDHARAKIPGVLAHLDAAGRWIQAELALDVAPEAVSAVLLASALATVWGVAFAVLTRPERERRSRD